MCKKVIIPLHTQLKNFTYFSSSPSSVGGCGYSSPTLKCIVNWEVHLTKKNTATPRLPGLPTASGMAHPKRTWPRKTSTAKAATFQRTTFGEEVV